MSKHRYCAIGGTPSSGKCVVCGCDAEGECGYSGENKNTWTALLSQTSPAFYQAYRAALKEARHGV